MDHVGSIEKTSFKIIDLKIYCGLKSFKRPLYKVRIKGYAL